MPAGETASAPPVADALVVFGISGDLARKMTLKSLYLLERRGMLDCPVIGVARERWTDDRLRQHALEAVKASGVPFSKKVFERFAARLSYVAGDFSRVTTYRKLKTKLRGISNPVFYLEIPPFLFAGVVEHLHEAGLTKDARVVVEKPFGHDLASARRSTTSCASCSTRAALPDRPLPRERCRSRTSCTCGSPTPCSSRSGTASYIQSVQITMAESFGVEDRGSFYDPVGALRDVVQNHLMQVLALVAMEPPAGIGARRDRRPKARRVPGDAQRRPRQYVRGQYDGYRDVKGVAPTRRPRRSRRCGWRSTTGAGTACRSTSAPARRWPRR